MTDKENQDDEIFAVSNIYDGSVLTILVEDGEPGGQFTASFNLPEGFQVKAQKQQKTKNNDSGPQDLIGEEMECHSVKFLPPVNLNFTLPPDYPSTSPPKFTLSCKWLTEQQLGRLCKQLDFLWEQNRDSVILFTWFTFLQEEAFDFLGLQSPLDISKIISHTHCQKAPAGENEQHPDSDPRGIQDISTQAMLLPCILDYNRQALEEEFKRASHPCAVCYNEKLGAGCMRFYGCGHVYCNECMGNYFTVQIQEGNVLNLICPSEKCESEANPLQVKNLVSEELYTRYDKLLLQHGLDTMIDIVYCPRPACRMPVLMEKEQNMGSCANCSFIFCPLCKRGYHGLSPCKLRADELKKVREEYLEADPSTRAAMEKRYGKKIIDRILEEAFTDEWLKKFSKKCPACATNIEKIDGCNKMTCTKCRAYFCWICGAYLSRSNPYSHFSDANSNCNGLLFEGMDFDDDFGDF